MIISRLAPVLMTGLGSLVSLCHATGSLNGLPILNGPIPVVPQNDPDMKKGPGEFIHPGLWHTHDDLERIKKGVENNEEPYASAFEKFSANEYSQANVSVYFSSREQIRAGILITWHSTRCEAPALFYAVVPAATTRLHSRLMSVAHTRTP